jgi:tetratricopeptide (TPR) repeat protein
MFAKQQASGMMLSMKSVALLLALLFMQDVRLAEVQGKVRDMQGRPIAGADVVYTNINNNKTYRFKTDKDGGFHAIGLQIGIYKIEITGPKGNHIYSGQKAVPDKDGKISLAGRVSITEIDLSLVPPKASLTPFKGTSTDELKSIREKLDRGKELTKAELAELRSDNTLIGRYNELVPETQAALKEQDWKHAADLLKQLVEIAPYKWELYQNLGMIESDLRQYSDAVAAFERGIQVLTDDTLLHQDHGKLNAVMATMRIGEGEALVFLNKFGEAAAQFRSATELDPKSAIAFLHLCTAEYNNGNTGAAVAACSRAIVIEPARVEGYQVLATIQSNLDLQKDAIRTYEKGIAMALGSMRKDQPSLKSNINSQHVADPSKAIAEAVRAGQMMQSLGNIYFQLKNYRKAAELFSQAAPLHPYPALPLFNLCATLYDMHDFSAAIAACDRAIDADPKAPDSYFVKASAMYGEAAQKGKVRASHDAISALEKYLQLTPDGFYANDARAMLQEMNAAH